MDIISVFLFSIIVFIFSSSYGISYSQERILKQIEEKGLFVIDGEIIVVDVKKTESLNRNEEDTWE